ncbi:hypothetical protein IE81DRAFT_245708 [Ceraceosorus guamensis]|uniref:Uncharacterized protein n=1 Tax=Ceraceosorus guamensis TaxID=1522189 RepID=A0A316VRE1_9BASI|nr:hypothetical protein IE81DRAFT_245708 [Ceraceosorus guamensis]PWN40082.1 hypothetical protein IE81DRAFT_245708 [Ceraceosorus guamensis]
MRSSSVTPHPGTLVQLAPFFLRKSSLQSCCVMPVLRRSRSGSQHVSSLARCGYLGPSLRPVTCSPICTAINGRTAKSCLLTLLNDLLWHTKRLLMHWPRHADLCCDLRGFEIELRR